MSESEVRPSGNFVCRGAMQGRIAPLDEPATPLVITYNNGEIAVGCDYLSRETAMCGVAAKLGRMGLEDRCAYLFPVVKPNNRETALDPDTLHPTTILERQTPFGRLTLNLTRLEVESSPLRDNGQAPISLTRAEQIVLEMLMIYQGSVVSSPSLVHRLYGNSDTDPDAAAVYIRRIRKKLGDKERELIRTERREGFIIDKVEIDSEMSTSQ